MPAIGRFVSLLRERGLEVSVGALGSQVTGESANVFAALSEAYQDACVDGTAVLLIKIANVAPDLVDKDR